MSERRGRKSESLSFQPWTEHRASCPIDGLFFAALRWTWLPVIAFGVTLLELHSSILSLHAIGMPAQVVPLQPSTVAVVPMA
jgi:hypothetical protein